MPLGIITHWTGCFCSFVKIFFPTAAVMFQKAFTELGFDCSRYPRLEMNFKLYADMLRNVPIHSPEQFEHFLNVTSGNFDWTSQGTPSYLSKSKKSKKAASLLDLLHQNRELANGPSKSHQAKPDSCSIEMVDLSPGELTKRRNSCRSAFKDCDTAPTADVQVHNPLSSTMDEENTLKDENTPKDPTFSDLAKDRHKSSKSAAPQPQENDSPV